MRIAPLALASIVGLLGPSASADVNPVAAANLGCGVIVTGNGDLYVSGLQGPGGICPREQGAWHLLSNVFASAGIAPGTVVGMNEDGQLLAANGDWFQLTIDYNNCNSISSTFQANVFTATRSGTPGETFEAFGGRGYEYAVTNQGNIYRWANCNGTPWTYLGPLIAPTGITGRSWGSVKVRYSSHDDK